MVCGFQTYRISLASRRCNASRDNHSVSWLLYLVSLRFTKVFFSASVVNTWNSLRNSVVMLVFKARLDKCWQQEAVKFDFTADLMDTGNRSEEVIK